MRKLAAGGSRALRAVSGLIAVGVEHFDGIRGRKGASTVLTEDTPDSHPLRRRAARIAGD